MPHFWCEQLGYVSHASLGMSFNGSLWFRRQLQNGCLLAFTIGVLPDDTRFKPTGRA
jgi:hypothetical protein